MAEEALVPQMGNAFGTLLQQVLRAGVGLAGMATIASGVSSALEALAHGASAALTVFLTPLKAAGEVLMGVGKSLANLLSPGTALSELFTSFGNAISSIISSITSVIGSAIRAFTSLTDAAAKLTTGLFELGAAATPGGIQAFAQVMEYITVVIGRVAVPVFVALASAALAVVKYFAGPLTTAAEKVAEWMGQYLVRAILATIDFFSTAVPAAFKKVVDWTLEHVETIKKIVNAYIAMGQAMLDFVKSLPLIGRLFPKNEEQSDWGKAMAGAITGAIKGPDVEGPAEAPAADDQRAQKITELVGESMKDFVGATRDAFSKQANVGYSGIADVQKTIQQQAFRNNIQNQTLQEQIKTRSLIERLVEIMSGKGGGLQTGALAP